MEAKEPKVFNDPVHGQIKIPALCIRIIDTPQFQRLRRIQQLGGVSYVYYGATHTRFEHSIGVCYLAGALLEHLRKEQSDLNIDEKDILCVQVAGLCHDLGHGPYSHVWEKNVVKKLGYSGVKHEDLSVKIFKRLVDKNGLEREFKKHLHLSHDDDEGLKKELRFIQELIKGEKNTNGASEMDGRKEHKAFLYDIISNNMNGIDVDKWDYFARDCYYLGIKSSFDHLRLMNFARVLKVSEERQVAIYHISYRDKEVLDVYGLFHTRIRLHQMAYQHKTVKAVEGMLSDVILQVKDLKVFKEGQDDKKKTLMDVIQGLTVDKPSDDTLAAYESLDDTVISRIKQMDPKSYSKEEEKAALSKAQALIKRLEERKLYRCFRSAPINAEEIQDLNKAKIAELERHFLEESHLLKEEFDFDSVTYDYGMENENPVDNVYFYEKSNLNTPINIPKEQVSMMLTENFSESRLIMLLKRPLDDKEEIGYFKSKFENFCKESFPSLQVVPPALRRIQIQDGMQHL